MSATARQSSRDASPCCKVPLRESETQVPLVHAGAQHVILSLSPDPYAEVASDAVGKAAKILDRL